MQERRWNFTNVENCMEAAAFRWHRVSFPRTCIRNLSTGLHDVLFVWSSWKRIPKCCSPHLRGLAPVDDLTTLYHTQFYSPVICSQFSKRRNWYSKHEIEYSRKRPLERILKQALPRSWRRPPGWKRHLKAHTEIHKIHSTFSIFWKRFSAGIFSEGEKERGGVKVVPRAPGRGRRLVEAALRDRLAGLDHRRHGPGLFLLKS